MSADPARDRPSIVGLGLVLAAAALTFAPSLLGGFVWDDQLLVVANERVRHLGELRHVFDRGFWDISLASADVRGGAYYRPLIGAALVVEFQLFGLRALGYHAVNVALHLACTALAARWLLRRLRIDSPEAPSIELAALVGAALFAVHPSRVESVAWISGCTDLWATVFALGALLAWQRVDRPRSALAAAGLTLVAGLCKESVLLLPLVFAVERGRRPWRDLGWPAGAVALVLAARVAAIGATAVNPSQDEPATAAVARVLSSVGHLARLIVVPWPSTVMPAFFRFDAAGTLVYEPWSVALGAAVVAAVVVLLLAARRHPSLAPWARDAALFAIALLPAINLVPLRLQSLVSPRFLYLPMLGVSALAARALAEVPHEKARVTALACGAALLLSASVVVQHTAAFASNADLWAWEVDRNPDNHFALKALSIARTRQHRPEDALGLSLRAFAAAGRLHAHQAQVDRALDVASRLSDLTPEADQETLVAVRSFLEAFAPGRAGPATLDARGLHLRLALDDADRDGRVHHAWRIPYAIALARTLRYAESEAVLRAVLHDQPRDSLAWRNLLLVTACQERWGDALAACTPALAANPTDLGARSLCAAVATAAHEAQADPGDPTERLIARSRRLLSVGARELVRRTVAPVAVVHPERLDLGLLLVRADLADGLLDRARARLDALRGLGATPESDALRAELDRRSAP